MESWVTRIMVLPLPPDQGKEHVLDGARIALVEIPCRLVREEQPRLVDQGPRNGNSLALSAGKLEGPGVHPVVETHLGKKLPSALPQGARGFAAQHARG